MRIEVSQLPPISASPNWRGNWAERYKAGKVYQEAVFYSCVDARNRLESVPRRPGFTPFRKARLDLSFVFPNHRTRDEDNLRARFKPGQDAIVDAGLIIDDDPEHLTMGKVNILVDPDRAPLTVIEIEELNEIKKLEGE